MANLQLREAHLDIDLEPALITLPEEAKRAELDPKTARGLAALASPTLLREAAFLHVERVLASSQRPWDERARADWRSFLTVLYRDAFDQQFSTEREGLEEWVDEIATWLRSRWKSDDSPEERAALEQNVADYRRELEKRIDDDSASASGSLPPLRSHEIEPRQELFDIELEVMADVWDERMRKPVLESLDTKIAAARGR